MTNDKGIIAETQLFSTSCILIKTYYLNRYTQIVVVDDVVYISINKKVDRVIMIELIKQF